MMPKHSHNSSSRGLRDRKVYREEKDGGKRDDYTSSAHGHRLSESASDRFRQATKCRSKERAGSSNHLSDEKGRSSRSRKKNNSDDSFSDSQPGRSKRTVKRSPDPDDPTRPFDWEKHKSTLCRIFFRDKDVIKRGTPAYHDFWPFLKKYQAYEQKNAIRLATKQRPPNEAENALGFPTKYDKRYRISFSVMTGDMEELMSRVPMDMDEEDYLPREKIAEFRYILLLYLDFMQKQNFAKLKQLREGQNNLPIAQYRESIVEAIRRCPVVVVAGDTGCGKSTQVPRYLLEAGFEDIACTQPRRLACISLCKRVAYETLNEFGSSVGYQIRFDKSKTQHTKVLFLTEGLLLRQVAVDPLLSQYNVLILDEVHERHLHGDFLLGVVKCMVKQRDDLKVILMSATINIDLFRNYFWGAPVIQVPGRLYPIRILYRPVSVEEQASRTERISPAPYLRILQMIDEKYPEDERGDLLIFLSGMTEISTVVEAAQTYSLQTKRWIILPLHSTLSLAEQDKVFDIAPEGVRKCIVSTNIAETSITIDGIRFVADSGKVKEMNYDPSCKMQRLQEFWISKASAEQRKGRSGRTGPGVCFRLYAEADYTAMADYSTPEIQRVPLDSQILQMISLGLPDVRKFPFIEPPPAERVEEAVTSLKDHGAITDDEELTPIGRTLSNLPVDITIGKILIMGSLFDKVGPVLSLSAVLSVQSPFTNRSYRDPEAVAARRPLESDHGDPFTLLRAYNEWLEVKSNQHTNSRQWCKHRGIEEQRFYEITKLRKQFEELLKDSGLMEINNHRNMDKMSGVERAQRHGELKRLRELKRDFHRAPKKRKVLKLEEVEGLAGSEEDEVDIKDVDFKIQHTKSQIKELSMTSGDFTYRDLLMLKIILCSGLSPQFALADEHNSYKPGSDQVFHTRVKPFVILHPMGIFANQPEVLQLNDSDIIEHPNLTSRHSISNRHQLILYVSLLETTKPYLMNTLRCPAIQSLLLFSRSIDTNSDFSRIVFDEWLEVRFPEPICGQDLAMQALLIRKLWEDILQLKLQKKECDQEVVLTKKLLGFLQEEAFYTIHRLLAADVKTLHCGPGRLKFDCSQVPGLEGAAPHPTKGGLRVSENLTYSCLQDEPDSSETYLLSKWICPFCEEPMMVSVLERMYHQVDCREAAEKRDREGLEPSSQDTKFDPSKQKYECDECHKTLFLSNTEILKHKRSHRSSVNVSIPD